MRERTDLEKYALTVHALRQKIGELEKRFLESTPQDLPPMKIQLEVQKAVLCFTPGVGLGIETDKNTSVALIRAPTMVILASVGHLAQVKEYIDNALQVQVSDLEQCVKMIDALLAMP